jgi:phage-related protein
VADLSLVFDLLARDRASSEVDKVGDSMKGAGDQADGFGDKVSGMFAGLAAGAAGAGLAVGASFMSALESEGATRMTTAQLGLDPAESAAVGKMAGELFAGNYGDSLEGVNTAVGAVASSIEGLGPIGSEAMQTATRDALNFASTFDVDVSEAAASAGNLIRNGLAPDATTAFDLMTAAAQRVPASMRGELGPILDEYGTNFAALGFTGEQAFALLTNAADGGAVVLDKTGDALKEFTILVGSDLAATGPIMEGLGLDAEAMNDAVAAGGPGAQAAMQQIAQALLSIEDPGERAEKAIGLFGTPLEDLGVDKIPSFLSAVAGVGPGMTDAAGAADALDATLATGIGPRLETLKRGLQTAASEGMTALLNGFTQGTTDAGGWQGTLQNLAASLSGTLGPALEGVGSFLTGTVGPALSSVFGFLSENQTTVTVIAGLISGVLAAAFLVWGTRSTVAAAQNTAAWFATAASSSTGAAAQQRSALQVVTGWVLMGTQALLHGLKVAAVWTAQIVMSAVSGAASFAVSAAQVVAGWVLMGAQAFAQGVRIAAVWTAQVIASAVAAAASMAVQVALIVGGWVLMGVQSMIQAARMAAAWFIALGPVGWVIAAVIGLVALIVANWDSVVSATTAAWDWVTTKIGEAWQWIVDKVTGAAAAVWGAITDAWNTVKTKTTEAWDAVKTAVSTAITNVVTFVTELPGKIVSGLASLGSLIAGVATTAWQWFYQNVVTKAGEAVSWVAGLPGRLLSALGNLGSLLLDAGGDLLRGLWNGISGAASWLLGKVGSFFGSLLPGWVKDMLGISSPSKVFASFGRDSMRGFAVGIDGEAGSAIGAVQRAVAGIADVGSGLSADLSVGGTLGYRPPRYDGGGGLATAAGTTINNHTTINAAPTIPTEDQLAGVYRRAQLLTPRR